MPKSTSAAPRPPPPTSTGKVPAPPAGGKKKKGFAAKQTGAFNDQGAGTPPFPDGLKKFAEMIAHDQEAVLLVLLAMRLLFLRRKNCLDFARMNLRNYDEARRRAAGTANWHWTIEHVPPFAKRVARPLAKLLDFAQQSKWFAGHYGTPPLLCRQLFVDALVFLVFDIMLCAHPKPCTALRSLSSPRRLVCCVCVLHRLYYVGCTFGDRTLARMAIGSPFDPGLTRGPEEAKLTQKNNDDKGTIQRCVVRPHVTTRRGRARRAPPPLSTHSRGSLARRRVLARAKHENVAPLGGYIKWSEADGYHWAGFNFFNMKNAGGRLNSRQPPTPSGFCHVMAILQGQIDGCDPNDDIPSQARGRWYRNATRDGNATLFWGSAPYRVFVFTRDVGLSGMERISAVRADASREAELLQDATLLMERGTALDSLDGWRHLYPEAVRDVETLMEQRKVVLNLGDDQQVKALAWDYPAKDAKLRARVFGSYKKVQLPADALRKLELLGEEGSASGLLQELESRPRPRPRRTR